MIIGFNKRLEVNKIYTKNIRTARVAPGKFKYAGPVTFQVIREATLEEWKEEFKETLTNSDIDKATNKIKNGIGFIYEISTD